MEVKRPQWGKNQNCQKSELSKKAKKAQTTVWTIRYHRSDMTGINCVRCVENRAFAGGAAGVGKKDNSKTSIPMQTIKKLSPPFLYFCALFKKFPVKILV